MPKSRSKKKKKPQSLQRLLVSVPADLILTLLSVGEMSVDSLTINLQGEFTKSQVYQIVWRLCNIGKVTRSRTDEKAPWVYKLVKKTPQEDCDG